MSFNLVDHDDSSIRAVDLVLSESEARRREHTKAGIADGRLCDEQPIRQIALGCSTLILHNVHQYNNQVSIFIEPNSYQALHFCWWCQFGALHVL